jgi:hypothetical protein
MTTRRTENAQKKRANLKEMTKIMIRKRYYLFAIDFNGSSNLNLGHNVCRHVDSKNKGSEELEISLNLRRKAM